MLFAVLVALSGCSRVQPVTNIENASVVFDLPSSSVKKAILEAGISRDWIMSITAPGVIRAEQIVRSHKAVIEITFDKKTYSINYVDSIDLKYKDGKIHRNYNRWIRNLEVDINQNLARLAASK